MTDLTKLAEKVEGLTGPDEAVDADVFRALGRRVETAGGTHYLVASHIGDAEWRVANGYSTIPRITASVDAVLALIAEKLPDDMLGLIEEAVTHLLLSERPKVDELARFILAAFLRAMENDNDR